MRAQELKPGDQVQHSGRLHEVMDVRIDGPFVTIITHNGGRASFLATDKVITA